MSEKQYKAGEYPDMMEWLGLLAKHYPGHASGQRAKSALDTIQAQDERIAELEAARNRVGGLIDKAMNDLERMAIHGDAHLDAYEHLKDAKVYLN